METRNTVLRIQAFAESMAERSDAAAVGLAEDSNMNGARIARARAEAFWVVRNYIEDVFLFEDEENNEGA